MQESELSCFPDYSLLVQAGAGNMAAGRAGGWRN